jgi:protocatechuate 3,4-dioxygenase beta subunit
MNTRSHHHHDDENLDRGLAFDLGTLVSRRRLLTLFAGTAGAAVLVACGSSDGASGSTASAASDTTTPSTASTASTAATTATAATADAPACAVIPEETAGPYPGDGSNGPNVLAESGIVRSDITASFGSSTTVAEGVPLAITLNITDTASGCTPMEGASVYLWHCNIDGQYSMYGQGVTDENYLRGVQTAGADGTVTFTSIFPAAYSGRWPHIHYEVYASEADATGGGTPLATSQIALPEDTCKVVYASDGYSQSVSNLSQSSLSTDNVFSDGWDQELGVITGDIDSGLTVTLSVPV